MISNCSADDWLVMVKLNLWKKGYVDGVGYVKALNAMEQVRSLFGKLAAQSRYIKPHLVLMNYHRAQDNGCYNLCFAIHDVYTGMWDVRNYLLRSEGKGIWLEKPENKKVQSNIFQMVKSAPFELKDRGNYSVRGRQLPKPRGFKK